MNKFNILIAMLVCLNICGCSDFLEEDPKGKLTTLQYELMKLLSSVTNQGNSVEAMKNAAGSVTPTSVRAAATILTMLPIICLYPFLQRYFVTGLTIGGVKE